MFKKVLFVFLLAAAVLAFAGYSVPTASACSASAADDCRPTFGSRVDDAQGFVLFSPTASSTPGAGLTIVDGVQHLKPFTTAVDRDNVDFASID
ncbi:MAG: hypothetical protein AB1817_13285 [Chloroflexota bacterium]